MLTAKVKVAVLYAVLPKDLQERVLGECALNWGETPEQHARQLLARIKIHVKNIAKAGCEASGPRAMEIEAARDWETWSGWGSWRSSIESDERESWSGDEKSEGEVRDIQLVGKGGKNGGKKVSTAIASLAVSSVTQRECGRRAAAKRRATADSKARATGRRPKQRVRQGPVEREGPGQGLLVRQGVRQGAERDLPRSCMEATSKGTASHDWRGGMQKACFGCESTEHLMRDRPKNHARVQNVEEEPEVLFIGRIGDSSKCEDEIPAAAWMKTQAPRKIPTGRCSGQPVKVQESSKKPMFWKLFKVMEEDEEDE